MLLAPDPYTAYFEAPEQVPLNQMQYIPIAEPLVDQIQQVYWKMDGVTIDSSYTLEILFNQDGIYELQVEIIDLDGCISSHTETIIAGTVGTIDLAITNIQIQPNPTKNLIHLLNLESLSDGYSLRLINTIGQTVYQQTPSRGIDRLSIDLSDLPSGIYLLHIESATQQYQGKKIVKIQ